MPPWASRKKEGNSKQASKTKPNQTKPSRHSWKAILSEVKDWVWSVHPAQHGRCIKRSPCQVATKSHTKDKCQNGKCKRILVAADFLFATQRLGILRGSTQAWRERLYLLRITGQVSLLSICKGKWKPHSDLQEFKNYLIQTCALFKQYNEVDLSAQAI